MERLDGYIDSVIGHYKLLKDEKPKMLSFSDLDNLYAYNGLFNRIITAPANEAVRAGFCLKDGEKEIDDSGKIASICEDLKLAKIFGQALSWDRLYGGCAILMLADDGGELSEPLNCNNLEKIEKLEVFEPVNIQYDRGYTNEYSASYGGVETYTLLNYWGSPFTVHESRLLMFRGENISNALRRMRDGWGGRVADKISKILDTYDEGLALSLAAMGKLSQGILKLDGLADIMQSSIGDQAVQKRLALIDYARHLMNTIAIDKADDYDQKNLSLAGIKDLIQEYQTALSAVTEIPITVLFGRSPSGQNATGKADFEAYYNSVQRIQERILRPKLTKLLNIISACSEYRLSLPAEYNIEFNPLWNDSEKEIAETKKLNADAEVAAANAAKTYIEIGALDASEVRNRLIKDSDYLIDSTLDTTLDQPVAEM